LTVADVLELIHEHCGLSLHAAGVFTGGEVGATDVRGDHGSRFVLKWWEGDAAAGRRAAVLVERMRARGCPIPQFVIADHPGGVTVMLQEYIEGTVSDDVSAETVETLLALNEVQAGEGDGEPSDWSTYIAGSLHGCEGYCLHEPLRDYDRRSAALLDVVRATGEAVGDLPSGDVVHIDFHYRNVLLDGGVVTAVIDWEGCCSGDAAFDLVTLAFGLTVARVPAAARDRVWHEARRRTEPEALRA
jgi:aminoglycoside phosphotransferase (APT) family kinase protein